MHVRASCAAAAPIIMCCSCTQHDSVVLRASLAIHAACLQVVHHVSCMHAVLCTVAAAAWQTYASGLLSGGVSLHWW